MKPLTNVTFDELQVGQTVSVQRTLTHADIEGLAFATGDVDAFHLNGSTQESAITTEAVSAAAMMSHLLHRKLPGPGTRIVASNLNYRGTLCVGDALTGTVVVREKRDEGKLAVIECRCVNQRGDVMLDGTLTVAVPLKRISYDDFGAPEIIFRRTDDLARIIKAAESLPPVTCAVVHPCDRDSLLGPLEAARRGLIVPVLVGPEDKIRATAAAAQADISAFRIVSTEHSHAAAEKAVQMARAGEVEALMKGSLHTDELMGAVVPSATGLRTARRISHVFIMDVPSYPRPLLVTDAAINLQPDLRTKVDIVQNAIELAHVLGIGQPKVAILAAVETVNPDMPSTLDAAALCKMADRGQITGGILDGPLAFDNAISEQAAKTKKIVSPVAGHPDILLVPDLEAGNMVAKQLQYLAGADSAGIVLGTRVPIVLTSRADTVRTRLASIAVMSLVANSKRPKRPVV